MNDIAARLQAIQQEIIAAEVKANKPLGSVKLLAVTKGHSQAEITSAIAAGQYFFGENYLQEALFKMRALATAMPAFYSKIEWHFIGTVQANKTRKIAENFAWVHSISDLKIAQRLNQQRSPALAPLNVCIEVNVDQEKTKSGISFKELHNLALAIQALPHLKLRGLMAIPNANACNNVEEQHCAFKRLRQALEKLNQQGLNLDTLSMGMSNDFVAAIMEGSTIVRIGNAIFGPRR